MTDTSPGLGNLVIPIRISTPCLTIARVSAVSRNIGNSAVIVLGGGVVGSGCLLAWCAAQETGVLMIDSMESVAPILHQSFSSF